MAGVSRSTVLVGASGLSEGQPAKTQFRHPVGGSLCYERCSSSTREMTPRARKQENMNLTTPAVGDTQHMRALQRANEVRHVRAALKRQIAEGKISASEVILSPSSETESMDLFELVMSQRSWGRIRSRELLNAVSLSETKTMGSMTDRQRRLVAAMLTAEDQPPPTT